MNTKSQVESAVIPFCTSARLWDEHKDFNTYFSHELKPPGAACKPEDPVQPRWPVGCPDCAWLVKFLSSSSLFVSSSSGQREEEFEHEFHQDSSSWNNERWNKSVKSDFLGFLLVFFLLDNPEISTSVAAAPGSVLDHQIELDRSSAALSDRIVSLQFFLTFSSRSRLAL